MITHQDDQVRKAACRVFNTITGNNSKVQQYALRYGAINLALQLERETTPAMREVILGCLSTFIRAENMPAKRKYIEDCGGLDQLIRWITLSEQKEQEVMGPLA